MEFRHASLKGKCELAISFVLKFWACPYRVKFSSNFYEGTQIGSVNTRFVYAIRSVEKGVEAGGMFCRIMNLSQPRTRFLSLRTDMLQNNLDLPSHTISDWKQFVHEVILDHVEENSEQIGGIDCIVQIDESILEKENIT
ncbi:hypothetical protein TNCV_3639471 [Trichonephila clavipes]|nr:hypothetical protein TNCV_3639471 [Trichonephila clavipes]